MLLAERRLGSVISDMGVKKNRSLARRTAPVDWLQRRAELGEQLAEMQQAEVPFTAGGLRPVRVGLSDSNSRHRHGLHAIRRARAALCGGTDRVYPISLPNTKFQPSHRDRRAEQYNSDFTPSRRESHEPTSRYAARAHRDNRSQAG